MNEREKKLNDMLDELNDKLDKALALKARQQMGMSIDKAIEHGKEQLEIFGGEHKEFIKISIDTMRKYQKIEEIYKNWCYPTQINAVEAMNKIGEVLKDDRLGLRSN